MQSVGELIEFLEFVDMDMLAIGGEEFFFLKAGKHATYRFHSQAQVVADIVARHAEHKFMGGVAAQCKPVGQVTEKGGDAFIRCGSAQQRNEPLLVIKLLAHDTQQLALQAGCVIKDIIEAGEGDFTHAAGLQYSRGAFVKAGLNGVQADDLAG